ncbi:hypothetical protein PQE70_gp228 [Bacillus phage vB_BanS_Nate]|uniref:Uncharacterized protein n=1 Tax=Bacillus phage vB_BanS_Nate TaxID=2894788 RepID=A0AAE8YV36_9CAUD|nr:hypothetical protein PQE70_gp228 [Bacillus phage vB_BanS_Nate]UGO51081.1 hypothetical protein NATE_228 [Bacillus phage vB_BanS_Nate]
MAIVRKDKLLAGSNGNLESVIVHDKADKTLQITNGVFVTVGALMQIPNDREVKKAKLSDTGSHTEEVLLIHNAEVMYDERLYKLEDYRIEAGKVARAYRLYTGDIFTLTVDLFTGTPVVGDKFIASANGKLKKEDATNLAKDAKIVFEVIEDSNYELHQTMKAFAVQVTRN